jgi:hypothetical protein
MSSGTEQPVGAAEAKSPASKLHDPIPPHEVEENERPAFALGLEANVLSALVWWVFGASFQALFIGLVVFFSLRSGHVFAPGWDDPFYGYFSSGQLLVVASGGVLAFGIVPLVTGVVRQRRGLVARSCDIIGLWLAVLLMTQLVSSVLASLGFRPGFAIGSMAAFQNDALAALAVPVALHVAILSALGGQLVAGIGTFVYCETGRSRQRELRPIGRLAVFAVLCIGWFSVSKGHLIGIDESTPKKYAEFLTQAAAATSSQNTTHTNSAGRR